MTLQDTENALKAHMQNDNGQYKSEIYVMPLGWRKVPR